jgi:hypothetical protein
MNILAAKNTDEFGRTKHLLCLFFSYFYQKICGFHHMLEVCVLIIQGLASLGIGINSHVNDNESDAILYKSKKY